MTPLAGVRALLFDLDGTLVDSLDDLAASGNWLRQARGLPPLPRERVAAFVGEGMQSLVSRLLDSPAPDDLRAALDAMRRHYDAHCLDHTRLYEGAVPALDALARRGLKLAVVTNKPEAMARRILDGLGVGGRFGSVVGGDTLSVRKPDPAPLRKACADLGVDPAAAAMVGDSHVDVLAGRALGVPTLAFVGRIGCQQRLRDARPDHLIESFAGLARLFQAA